MELATLLGHASLDTTAVHALPSEEELAEEVEHGATTSMHDRQGLMLPEDLL